MLDKIQEILTTNQLQKLNNFQQDPKVVAVNELAQIWGVGNTKANELMKKGFMSVQDLRHRLDSSSSSSSSSSQSSSSSSSNNYRNNGLTGILTRQQQIGLQFYEDFLTRIPRSEVRKDSSIVKISREYGE